MTRAAAIVGNAADFRSFRATRGWHSTCTCTQQMAGADVMASLSAEERRALLGRCNRNLRPLLVLLLNELEERRPVGTARPEVPDSGEAGPASAAGAATREPPPLLNRAKRG
jgi:hypothetical protein